MTSYDQACWLCGGATLDHCHIMQIHDNPSDLRLSLYADVDFGSASDMKSTSSIICSAFVVQQAIKSFLLNLYRFLRLFFMRLFRYLRFARSSSSTKWC